MHIQAGPVQVYCGSSIFFSELFGYQPPEHRVKEFPFQMCN